MHSFFLPYRTLDYESPLSPAEIELRLQQSVITGISLYSVKPYYGRYSAFDFTVRKVSSRMKKQSLSATVEGMYRERGAITSVSLCLRPHPLLLIFFGLFCLPVVLIGISSIADLFRSWDIGAALGGCVPGFVAYLIVCAVFNAQFNAAQRFWEFTLQLQKTGTETSPAFT